MSTLTVVPRTPGMSARTRRPDGHAGTLRLTARGRRVLGAAALSLCGAVVLLGGRADAGAPARGLEVSSHVVAAGETWWSLAGSVAEPGADLRDVVADLMAMNGATTAALNTGQVVLVPAD